MIFFCEGIQYLGFGVFNWADIFKNKSHKMLRMVSETNLGIWVFNHKEMF